jgi:hypothetical protein
VCEVVAGDDRLAHQAGEERLVVVAHVRGAGRRADLDVAQAGIPQQPVRASPDAGLLNGYTVDQATLHFHAVCEGLAGLELRETFPAHAADRLWRQGLTALVRGLACPG